MLFWYAYHSCRMVLCNFLDISSGVVFGYFSAHFLPYEHRATKKLTDKSCFLLSIVDKWIDGIELNRVVLLQSVCAQLNISFLDLEFLSFKSLIFG